jgi:UDP-N-acetylmuramoyl-tripeptide--D-alanyl-D-alanine ligase
MKTITVGEILKVLNGQLLQGSLDLKVTSISTDTRALKPGDFFVALKGENFDGHTFLTQAFEKGACGALISSESGEVFPHDRALICVENTLKGLQDLAKWNRMSIAPKVVGVTGSTGKTTTKDMIAQVLSMGYKTLKTKGNYNTEIGLPLTLIELDDTYQAAVVEMGMRGFGQIRELALIAKPDIGVITNIGESHMELLGSKNGIARAKAELIEELDENGIAVLNGDDPFVCEMKEYSKGSTYTYGTGEAMDVRAIDIVSNGEDGIEFTVVSWKGKERIQVPLPGLHNVYNSLAAICVGLLEGLDLHVIAQGLAEFKVGERRGVIINLPNGLKIIDDTYNASPASVGAAIRVLTEVAGDRRKVAILADMLELGDFSLKGHRIVGELLASSEVDLFFGIGPLSKNTVAAAQEGGMHESAFWFASKEEALQKFWGIACKGDVILVKGSLSMNMQEIVEGLKREPASL